jgi:hypothetical protein
MKLFLIKFTDEVYMISYSDNKSADYVSKLNEKEIEKLVEEVTGFKIKIVDKLILYLLLLALLDNDINLCLHY